MLCVYLLKIRPFLCWFIRLKTFGPSCWNPALLTTPTALCANGIEKGFLWKNGALGE